MLYFLIGSALLLGLASRLARLAPGATWSRAALGGLTGAVLGVGLALLGTVVCVQLTPHHGQRPLLPTFYLLGWCMILVPMLSFAALIRQLQLPPRAERTRPAWAEKLRPRARPAASVPQENVSFQGILNGIIAPTEAIPPASEAKGETPPDTPPDHHTEDHP